MPRHETIESNLLDIFSKHKDFFDRMKEDTQMDAYKNAFMSLHRKKGLDLAHLENCFESLRQACQEAMEGVAKQDATPVDVQINSIPEVDKIIGGEIDLRQVLNEKLGGKTVARATLYNYLQELGIRKSLYTHKDLDAVIRHIKNQKIVRNKD